MMKQEEADELLDMLEELYLIRDRDPSFASGRRSRLLFAVPSMRAAYSKVNAQGPDPREYVQFAQHDLLLGGPSAAINAVGNAKRAIHLGVDAFLKIYCLGKWAARRPFPVVLQMVADLGAFPTRILYSLNRRRNLIEHEYTQPSAAETEELVDVAELFCTLVYRFLRGAVIGAYVGVEGSDRCQEWLLSPNSEIHVLDVESINLIPTEWGVVHFNVTDEMPRKLVERIPLTGERQEDWLPVLDLFVYATRAEFFRLGGLGPPGRIVPIRVSFECTDKRDEHGRRQFVINQVTMAPKSLLAGEGEGMGHRGTASAKPKDQEQGE